jgi:hypothetical protein
MGDRPQPWDDVAQQFRQLGRHMQERLKERAAGAAPEAEQDRAGVEQALRALGETVSKAVEAVGAAVRDPGFREQAKHAAESLGTAITASLAGLSGEMRDHFDARADAEAEAQADSGPPVAPDAEPPGEEATDPAP